MGSQENQSVYEESPAKVRTQERVRAAEVYLDKVQGALFGGAIGDALGYPIMSMTMDEIQTIYGEAGIQSYQLDSNTGKALISAHTQMMLFTVCGVLKGATSFAWRGVAASPVRYAEDAYLDWLYTQTGELYVDAWSWIVKRKELHARRSPEDICLIAVENSIPYSLRSSLGGEKPLADSKGCGGVTRIAPIALLELTGNRSVRERAKDGAELARFTHRNPMGYIPAALLTYIIYRSATCADTNVSLRDIVCEGVVVTGQIYGENACWGEFCSCINNALNYAGNDRRDLENIVALGNGQTAAEAVTTAIYCCARYSDDFDKAVIAAVNHSGESSAIGSITGSVMGARLGLEKINKSWRRDLELADVILELAADLCHGCQMGEEYDGYWDEDWLKKYFHKQVKAPSR